MSKVEKKTEYNSLCKKCVRSCRQFADVLLLDCPRFLRRPFKVDEHRYDQLDLFGQPKKRKP